MKAIVDEILTAKVMAIYIEVVFGQSPLELLCASSVIAFMSVSLVFYISCLLALFFVFCKCSKDYI